jgi:hypothetical protein
VPYHAKWEEDGIVPRELWLKAGAAGLLCCTVPAEYGGMGLDYLFDVVVFEELWRSGASAPGFLIHTDMVATPARGAESGCPKQTREKDLPDGMTNHASDLKATRTRAVRDGDDRRQRLKVSGFQCPATKTDSHAGAKGVTLSLLSRATGPASNAPNQESLGMKACDTRNQLRQSIPLATCWAGKRGFAQITNRRRCPRRYRYGRRNGYRLYAKNAAERSAFFSQKICHPEYLPSSPAQAHRHVRVFADTHRALHGGRADPSTQRMAIHPSFTAKRTNAPSGLGLHVECPIASLSDAGWFAGGSTRSEDDHRAEWPAARIVAEE